MNEARCHFVDIGKIEMRSFNCSQLPEPFPPPPPFPSLPEPLPPPPPFPLLPKYVSNKKLFKMKQKLFFFQNNYNCVKFIVLNNTSSF